MALVRRFASLACSLVLGAALAPPARAVIWSNDELTLTQRRVSVTVVRPDAAPRGAVVLAHGFLRSPVQLHDLAAALADAGYLVLLPALPHLADHEANGAALADLVARLRGGAFGAVPARVVLGGFSAGGLSSVVAGSLVPGLTGWVGLDPVDRAGIGLHAIPRMRAPGHIVRGPAVACNAYANSHSWHLGAMELRSDVLLAQASHCDFESPSDAVCAAVCGAADPATQAEIRRLAVAAVQDLMP